MKNREQKGFTLAELLVSIGIMLLILSAVSLFQKDVFSLAQNFQGNLNFQLGARAILKSFSAEVREASPSSLGAFPIEEASSTEIIFYSDADNDGLKERIRYFLSGSTIKKGVVKPTGTPLVYSTSTESIKTVLTSVVSTSSVFQYFDTTYTGTSSPLAQPVTLSSIRLIKAIVLVNPDPNRISIPYEITTEASIRNLKDNL